MKPIEKFEFGNNITVEDKINEIIDAVNYLLDAINHQSDIDNLVAYNPTDIIHHVASTPNIAMASNIHIHDKCYSPRINVFHYPAQRDWICRTCGEIGADKGEYYDYGEYERLVEKFKAEPPAE